MSATSSSLGTTRYTTAPIAVFSSTTNVLLEFSSGLSFSSTTVTLRTTTVLRGAGPRVPSSDRRTDSKNVFGTNSKFRTDAKRIWPVLADTENADPER